MEASRQNRESGCLVLKSKRLWRACGTCFNTAQPQPQLLKILVCSMKLTPDFSFAGTFLTAGFFALWAGFSAGFFLCWDGRFGCDTNKYKCLTRSVFTLMSTFLNRCFLRYRSLITAITYIKFMPNLLLGVCICHVSCIYFLEVVFQRALNEAMANLLLQYGRTACYRRGRLGLSYSLLVIDFC